MSQTVRVFEVGPRDGLQNEPLQLSLQERIEFIQNLERSGLKDIEAGAFVRPDRVPQMADSDQLFEALKKRSSQSSKTRFWGLVLNEKGYERSQAVGLKNLCLSTAASESFAQKNMGMNIQQSLQVFTRIVEKARAEQGRSAHIRVYISTSLGCPFEGKISVRKVMKVVERLALLEINEVSLGDTIGVGTPRDVSLLLKPVIECLGAKKVAVHYHDTRGTALANALRSLELGVRTIDSSAGGLGGCPFAPGAGGNLATEDLVYMLEGMGIKTGINLDLLCRASLELSKKMKRPLNSRFLRAFVSQCA